MSTQLSETRRLSSLTQEEARTLFALAFGYAPTDETLNTSALFGVVAIGDGTKTLRISGDGLLSAYDRDGAAQTINARKVISNIDALKLEFGPVQL
jgi:hypothetical protein